MASNPEQSENKQKRNNSDNVDSDEANQPEEDSKAAQEMSSKKRQRDWVQKDSKVSKVLINNRRQQKFIQYDASCEGIFLYKPGVELPSLFNFANQSIKVIVASEYIKKSNPQIIKKNIFGSDTYTSNSDCVCIAVHAGIINLNTFASKRYEGVQLTFKVIKPKKNYNGAIKNGLSSKSYKGYNGNALKPDGIRLLTSLGPIQNLQKYASNMHIPIGKNRFRPKPKNISNVIPIPQTHIIFNMNCEPAYKYSILNLADKGYEKNQFLVKKLETHALYLESINQQKYQLAKINQQGDVANYQLSKVKEPQKCDNFYFSNNFAPFPEQLLIPIFSDLKWQEIFWGNQSIQVRDYKIKGVISFKYHRKNVK